MALYPERDRLEIIESKYVLVNLAARRATQISHDHAPALVDQLGEHPLTIALLEIADGAVVPIRDEPVVGEAGAGFDVVEFGSSAAADSLDAAFADLFGEDQMVEEDVEGDLGAFGLIGAAVEPEVAATSDTISLTDLADEEEALEGEETVSPFGIFSLGDEDEEETETPA